MTNDHAQAHFAYTELNKLPFCGCGWGESFTEYAVELLRNPSAEIPLLGDMGTELLLQILNHLEWLDHGTSVGYSFITPAGEQLLAAIDKVGLDEATNAGFSCSDCPSEEA